MEKRIIAPLKPKRSRDEQGKRKGQAAKKEGEQAEKVEKGIIAPLKPKRSRVEQGKKERASR